MQGKDNMVLDYFIINIHMQLRRREAGYNSSNIPKAFTFTIKRKKEVAAVVNFFGLELTHARREEKASWRRLSFSGIHHLCYSQGSRFI